MSPDSPDFFPGFSTFDAEIADVSFRGVQGGSGPPVLLLHGYPQTHVTWRLIAPRLSGTFKVIAPDLPGYGGSRTLVHEHRWSKRRVANALTQLMSEFGHDSFHVVGHDRGARVGYRLALDHPERVQSFASLTVVPTLDVWESVDKDFARAAFHWFFLSQPFDLPERLLSGDPDAFIDAALRKMSVDIDRFDQDALAAYREAFRDPSVRHAMCEDYRAALSEDTEHDAADRSQGRKLACPVLVLWPEGRTGAGKTPLDIWRRWSDDVSGRAIRGGHLQPEESPGEVLADLLPFLAAAAKNVRTG